MPLSAWTPFLYVLTSCRSERAFIREPLINPTWPRDGGYFRSGLGAPTAVYSTYISGGATTPWTKIAPSLQSTRNEKRVAPPNRLILRYKACSYRHMSCALRLV